MPNNPELAVVIPVYNEAGNLPGLLRDWQQEFRSIGVFYTMILIDDGSKDDSLSLLRSMAAEDGTLRVYTQSNAGHGPAILKGYGLALDAGADWVFQIDSDHQLETTAFRRLWASREGYDLLLAQREEKNATRGRQRISAISGWMTRLLFGSTVSDVNSPYRLMRGECLRQALKKVPGDGFAPNILLTAWFVRKKNRIFTTTTENRQDGHLRQSKVSRQIFLGAWKSALQTLVFRIRL
jgi:dolichol-phosphate mannosyltransferase